MIVKLSFVSKDVSFEIHDDCHADLPIHTLIHSDCKSRGRAKAELRWAFISIHLHEGLCVCIHIHIHTCIKICIHI